MKGYGSIQHQVTSGSDDDGSIHLERCHEQLCDTPSRLRQAALPLITVVLGSLIVGITYLAGKSMSSDTLDGKTLAGINFSFAHHQHRFHNTDKPLFFEQMIDHNEPTTTTSGTFPQRYYMNNKYWKGPGSPIFIIFGGEGPLERLLYPFISEALAKAFGGLTLNLEHRYFGISFPHSQPTKQQIAEELTPRQVIEDMVYFIQQQREALGCDNDRSSPRYCPVMTVGASYAGLLSTLIRKIHPEVVDMAYAASPCLLLFSHLTTPYVYYEYVTQVADRLSGGCRTPFKKPLSNSMKSSNTFRLLNKWNKWHITTVFVVDPGIFPRTFETEKTWRRPLFRIRQISSLAPTWTFIRPLHNKSFMKDASSWNKMTSPCQIGCGSMSRQ